MKISAWASFSAVSLVVVACGGSKRPPSAPQAAAPVVTTAAPSPDPTPAPVVLAPSEADVTAFLAVKPGEAPADTAPIPGIADLSAKDSATLAKCDAVRKKALEKNAKQPMAKQLAAAMKAMEKADKHCVEIGLREQTQEGAKAHDLAAQAELRTLARGLAKSASCEKGATNPQPSAMGACFSSSQFLWDREGWSCVGKSMSEDEKVAFSASAAYVYAFHTDPDLKTFELVGRGCRMILGGAPGFAETELVVRGRLGQPTESLTILRRPVAKDAK